MKIMFADWTIAMAASNARQYDDNVWALDLTGELPEGWAWAALIAKGENLDIIELSPNEAGASAALTAAQLSMDGYYTIQIRGTKGEQVRHTNLVQAYVPRSLSGDANWPTLPTEFSQAEARIAAASAHPPIPGEDGYWKIWDTAAGAYKQSDTPLNVDPAEKTEAMTQAVGMDTSGKLWTEPGGKPLIVHGSGSPIYGKAARVCEVFVGSYTFTPGADFDLDEIKSAYAAGRMVYAMVTAMSQPIPMALQICFDNGMMIFSGMYAMTSTICGSATLTVTAKKEYVLEVGTALTNLQISGAAAGKILQISGMDAGYPTGLQAVDMPGETWEAIATVTSSGVYNPTDTEQAKWMTTKQYIPGSGGRTGNYINGLRYNFAKPYKKVRLTLTGKVNTFNSSDTADTKGLILTRGIAGSSDMYSPIIERDIMGPANNAPRGVYVEIQKDIGERHRAIAIVGDHPAYTEDSYSFGRAMVGGFRLDYGVKGNILGVGWQMEFDSAKCYVDGKSIELKMEGVPA